MSCWNSARVSSLAIVVGWLFTGSLLAAETRTSIADAAEQREKARVRSLLDAGEDPSLPQADGMTGLHWAAYHDDVEMGQWLIKAGANPDPSNRYQITPLALACRNGSSEFVKLLLRSGAEAGHELPGGATLLMIAARTGKPDPVRLLLEQQVEVNAKDRKEQTALMWAAADGHGEVVDALIAAGADVDAVLPSGFNALFFAVREGRTEVALRLLAAGVDVNQEMDVSKPAGNAPKSGTSPLLLAVENAHFETAAALLEAGADPNDMRAGYAPLHAITWVRKPLGGDGDPAPIGSGAIGSLDFVRLLIQSGADVNLPHAKANAPDSRLNKTDATAFLLAANTADLPLMKLLLEFGADPNLTNRDHCTPLLAAAGVDALGSGDEPGGTEAEAIEVMQFLLDLGADINAVDDLGNSAMHGAAFQEWTEMVQFVADHGADIHIWNRKNKRGWTPLLIAQGYRPGNFRPSPQTIVAISEVMRAAGVEPELEPREKSAQTP